MKIVLTVDIWDIQLDSGVQEISLRQICREEIYGFPSRHSMESTDATATL